jgi:cell wall-associated NlpC family hydrolase
VKVNQLVGLPWGLVDCWSLLQLAYRELLDIELPSYGIDPADTAAIAEAIRLGKSDWQRVEAPRFGDALLFRTTTLLPTHVAMALDEQTMLHIREGQLSQVDWYDDSFRGRLWRPRLEGIYRHVRMCQR